MTSIEKERNSLILELKINLRKVCWEKINKSLDSHRADLKRCLLGANPAFLDWGPSVTFMNRYSQVSWLITGPFSLSTMKPGWGGVWFTLGLINYSWSWKQMSLLITWRIANSYTPGPPTAETAAGKESVYAFEGKSTTCGLSVWNLILCFLETFNFNHWK